CCFCFTATASAATYTLSLHDALPISRTARRAAPVRFCPSQAPSGREISRFRLSAMAARNRVAGREAKTLPSAGLPSVSDLPKSRSEEHTSELQSRENLVCRLLLEKKK